MLPIFEGPEPGPGVRDVKGLDLIGLYRAAGYKGKRGETLLVPNTGIDGLTAAAVVLAGGRQARATRARTRAGERSDGSPADLEAGTGGDDDARRSRRARSTTRCRRPSRGSSSAPTGSTATSRSPTATSALTGGHRARRGAGPTRGRARAASERGQVIAESQSWARDLVNTPALDLPPAELAREAQTMAKRRSGSAAKVWTEGRAQEGRVRRDPRRRCREASTRRG